MYVRLKATKKVVVNGNERLCHPGDWVDVGTKIALDWIKSGQAEVPGPDPHKVEVVKGILSKMNCGVVLLGDKSKFEPATLGNCASYLKIHSEGLCVPFEKTMIFDVTSKVTPWQILLGFSRLEGEWEVVARLSNDKLLASNYGSEEERQKTLNLIGDLRLPVYSHSPIWFAKTDKAEKAVSVWSKELLEGADPEHSLLRSLYQYVPLIHTLSSSYGR